MTRLITIKNVSSVKKLSIEQGSKEYIKLRNTVIKAKILDRSYFYYIFLTFFSISLFLLSLLQLSITNQLLPFLFWTVLFSIFTVQIGGLVHDSAHRAVFKTNLANDIFGQICSAIIAFSYSNWKTTHNSHHAHTNEEGLDPDLGVPYSFTKEQLISAKGLRKLISKYQVWLYYPLGSFALLLMRVNNTQYYLQSLKNKKRIIESIVYFVSMTVWYILPFLIFPLWKSILFILVTSFASGLYMSGIFAPNHKGMPQIGRKVKFSFLEQQIITARNIYGHWLTDYAYLGLNYQIEHHLFPNCPRNKLHLLVPLIKAMCKKHGWSYESDSIIKTQKNILKELTNIQKLARSDY